MSSDAALPSSSISRQPTWSFKIQSLATPQTYAAKSAVDHKGDQTTTSVTTTPSSTGSETKHEFPNNESKADNVARKRRRLNNEEEEIKNEIAASVSVNLELDQLLTLYPDTDSPFQNEMDVLQRLLPYHIYQHPRHDLDKMRGLKGKAKATEVDLLREGIQESKFALECHKRYSSLQQRLRRVRIKPGKSTVPHDQAILVERMALETEHSDKAALERELSEARSELDKVLRTQRMAKAAASRASSAAPSSTSINGTSSTSPYYGYSAPTFSATSTAGYSNYYSSYTYPYTPSFLPGMRYTNTTRITSSIPGVSTFQTGSAGQTATSPTSNTTSSQTPAQSASGSTVTRPPPVAIPLQLPVTSLPALQSLGILPIPKSSAITDPNNQPAAVLLGTSNNGTMLSLEINAALLQPPQMSGLAILLSSLVKMSGVATGTGQSSGQAQTSGGGSEPQSTSNIGSTPQSGSGTGGKANGGK